MTESTLYAQVKFLTIEGRFISFIKFLNIAEANLPFTSYIIHKMELQKNRETWRILTKNKKRHPKQYLLKKNSRTMEEVRPAMSWQII